MANNVNSSNKMNNMNGNDFVLVLKNNNGSTASKERATKTAHIISLIVTYAFLVFMGIIIIFPFYWMLITSLKSGEEINRLIPTFFPQVIRWDNYSSAVTRPGFNFGILIKNTLIVGVVSTLGTLITTILAAFAFSKLSFKGRDTMFAILLGTMMIPGEMMVITNYISVSRLGMTDSNFGKYMALTIPFMVSVFYIYLLRQNFKQIPNELYLAAKVDGKGDWAFLWKVMVPLAMPTLTTIFILKLMGAWNSYVWPDLITHSDENMWLITVGLRNSFDVAGAIDDYGIQMAATVLVTVPLLLVFIFFRKYIMRGVGRAGIKG